MANFNKILYHGKNYLISNIGSKALAFVSIPVFTRLLTTYDYGIVSLYLGVVAIFASIITLSTDKSISRYYFDKKSNNDFKMFIGTSSVIAVTIFVIVSVLIVYNAQLIHLKTGLPRNTILLIIPISIINVIALTFEQIYGPQKMSRIIAMASIARTYISFMMSVILIYSLSTNKYNGPILGQIFTGLLFVIFWVWKISPYYKLSFRIQYVKYILTYSVPLIPYALSGIIIEQIGKIFIGNTQGIPQAGFYSLALAISSLVGIGISVSHQAWTPYFMEYMNEKKYQQIDSDFQKIFKITLIFAMIVAAFGYEIGNILAKENFTESLYLIPVFTIGYIFYQYSFAYLRNFGYSKKTYLSSITILISGVSNILLNYYLIDLYGELGSALSFTLSYFIMLLLSWSINRIFVKIHATSLLLLAKPVISIIPFYILIYGIFVYGSGVFMILIKVFLVALFSLILIWDDRSIIYSAFQRTFIKINN
ncbi:MAG: polysaccharide biosynthesis protein, partial [Bacteroidetes bacterium]|nr:polysaccharide biosynthesis protein [Bacteroidota bacterium]